MCLSAQATALGKKHEEDSSAAHGSAASMPLVMQHMHPQTQLSRFSSETVVEHIMANTIETTGRNPFGCEKPYTQPQAWMHQTSGQQTQISDLCFAANHKKLSNVLPRTEARSCWTVLWITS